jgi:phthiocerol/phenolphthiocerol synthesis type-I polyketide synthase C
LEALADYRQSLGLPALSIGWGAISDVGYVARNTALREMMESRAALKTISSKQALAELGHLITARATRATVAFDAQKFRKLAPSAGAPKFAAILAKLDDGDTSMGTPTDFLDTIKALEPAQRRQAMVKRLTQMLSRIMGTSATQLPVDRSLSELGVDSLMAVEFGGAVEDGLGIKMPAMEALEGSITDIAMQFLEMLGLKAELSDASSALESVQVADIEKMDEQEVDQLLEELTRETA